MTGSPRRQAASWAAGLLIGLVIGLLTIGGAAGAAFGIGIGVAFAIALINAPARKPGQNSDRTAGPHAEVARVSYRDQSIEPDADRHPRQSGGPKPGQGGPDGPRDADGEVGRP
ncbi:hypothetical protein [Micromonospora sp. NPDC005305]|uniref:hypothetical protein n=1 Tax=Micromonospora sp. NPDC005305 TaxID=3156875 RepID=UPI0033BF8C4D